MSPCPTIIFHFSAKNNNMLDSRSCEGKITMQKFIGSVLEAKEAHVLTYKENTYTKHL
jgi:hypothetical protein